MEMFQHIFVTIIAAFVFFMLITRITASTHKTNKILSKTKSKKKVSFALDHDQYVINKVIVEPSESTPVVFEPKIEDDQTNEEITTHEENVGKCLEMMCDDDIDEDLKEEIGLISDEDDDGDWEGVEKSDLLNMFGMAANYGENDDNLRSLESDVQMELYGLHKVATEGPCHEPQPMALKVSARAKWDAWQKLGNMDPDVAMEKYVMLLSEKVPGWSEGESASRIGD